MTNLVNKHASALIRLRWAKLSPEERAAAVPHNGGRPCIYPPCTRKYHRWKNDTCRFCGLKREPHSAPPPKRDQNLHAHPNGAGMTAERAKQAFRHLIVQYGVRWGPNVPKAAYELLQQADQALTADEKRELFISMGLATPPKPNP